MYMQALFLLVYLPIPTLGVCQKYVDAAVLAAAQLQTKYFAANGTYIGGQAIWTGAVDDWHLQRLDALTGESTYSSVIDTVYIGNEDALANGGSFDDVQWVAIDYLASGNLERAQFYYNIASTAVDSDYCGGGLFWSGARDYKNAITNELYMASSGYLYEITQDSQYLTNLNDTWTWLKATGMQGDNGWSVAARATVSAAHETNLLNLKLAAATAGDTEYLHWLETTDSDITFIGDAITPLTPLTSMITFCSTRTGNLCSGPCNVFTGAGVCHYTPNTNCMRATQNQNVAFCAGRNCNNGCNLYTSCGVRLNDGFCACPGTNSISLPV